MSVAVVDGARNVVAGTYLTSATVIDALSPFFGFAMRIHVLLLLSSIILEISEAKRLFLRWTLSYSAVTGHSRLSSSLRSTRPGTRLIRLEVLQNRIFSGGVLSPF